MQRKILSVAAAVIFTVTATVTVYAESAQPFVHCSGFALDMDFA